MNELSILVALLAGVLSFLSPCVLPLVPGYISFISGMSFEELKDKGSGRELMRKSGLMSVFFVLGFSIVFVAMGATATSVGRLFSGHIRFFTRIAGILIIMLGIHLAGVFRIPLLERHKKINVTDGSRGVFGAFFVGFAFAFGWSPCVGPLLGGIIALAATEETLAQGVGLLTAYSMGLGIPFIITGFAVGVFIRFFEKYRKFIKWGEISSGIFLIVLGVLIFFDRLSRVAFAVENFFTGVL